MGSIKHITVREVMVKKSKVKGGLKVSEEEETSESGKELYIPIPEQGGIIEFYYLFGGIAVVMAIIMIGYIFLHYLFHTL
jgi:hypothetical protein